MFRPSFSASRGSSTKEHRFAAVRAALRKQSLTHEPYSEFVAVKLWSILKNRKEIYGTTRMLRKELQLELTEALSANLNKNEMSKNKVNKIFQVLIRSCFTLLSRECNSHIVNCMQYEVGHCDSLQIPDERELRVENIDRDSIEEKSSGAVCELLTGIDSASHMVHLHNSLIVRVAGEAGVVLSGVEWAQFFCTSTFYSSSCEQPKIERVIQQPIIATSHNQHNITSAAEIAVAAAITRATTDPLGHLTESELCTFRTQWCTNLALHSSDTCQFMHHGRFDIRRDPRLIPYQPRRCPAVFTVAGCSRGESCAYAHAAEEVHFHPFVYKSRPCQNGMDCRMGRCCPFLHAPKVLHSNVQLNVTRAQYHRNVGVLAFLAALRKKSVDILLPSIRHHHMLQEIHALLRKFEPQGVNEKNLLYNVYISLQLPSAPMRFDNGSVDCAYSKTKVRGLISLLKLGGIIKADYTPPNTHMLHVAREIQGFDEFLNAHNHHLIALANEFGISMTTVDWQKILVLTERAENIVEIKKNELIDCSNQISNQFRIREYFGNSTDPLAKGIKPEPTTASIQHEVKYSVNTLPRIEENCDDDLTLRLARMNLTSSTFLRRATQPNVDFLSFERKCENAFNGNQGHFDFHTLHTVRNGNSDSQAESSNFELNSAEVQALSLSTKNALGLSQVGPSRSNISSCKYEVHGSCEMVTPISSAHRPSLENALTCQTKLEYGVNEPVSRNLSRLHSNFFGNTSFWVNEEKNNNPQDDGFSEVKSGQNILDDLLRIMSSDQDDVHLTEAQLNEETPEGLKPPKSPSPEKWYPFHD